MICRRCGAAYEQTDKFCGRCGFALGSPDSPVSKASRALEIRRHLPRQIMVPGVSVVTFTTALTILRWVWQFWSSQRNNTSLLPLPRKSPLSLLKRRNHQSTVVEETFVYRRIIRRE